VKTEIKKKHFDAIVDFTGIERFLWYTRKALFSGMYVGLFRNCRPFRTRNSD
jgi:ABC-type polysaccharide/polyol phosphate transport system ATPase subunit